MRVYFNVPNAKKKSMLCKDWGNGTEKGGRVREEEKKRKGWREGEPMPQGPPERSSSRVCSLNDRLLTVQSSAPWRLLRGAVPESPHLKNPLSHSFPSSVLYSSEKP